MRDGKCKSDIAVSRMTMKFVPRLFLAPLSFSKQRNQVEVVCLLFSHNYNTYYNILPSKGC
jgi:hypothetical protein